MPKPTTKRELLAEIQKERGKLEDLLDQIPVKQKNVEVCDGMSVKDFLAHRSEWGSMVLSWHDQARAGDTPAVPHQDFKWNQLPELNAQIMRKHKKTSLKKVEAEFARVHDELYDRVQKMSQKELFEKGFYGFTKSSNLAAYVNSASAAHYRSAAKHIRKWWKVRSTGSEH